MACTIPVSPRSTPKQMTENTHNNLSSPSPLTEFRLAGNRLPTFTALIGSVLALWGAHQPVNGMLILLGAAIFAFSLFLGYRTQFGRLGRTIVEEDYVRQPDGSISNYNFRLKLTKLEIFMYAAAFLLVLLGLRGTMNWLLISTGVLFICATQLYGNYMWFGSSTIGFSDSLSPGYEKLRNIGDEVRGGGYVVRRVEKGLRYIEGSRSLTLRSGWAFVEKERIQNPDGGTREGDKLRVVIQASFASKTRWDAPHHGEKIPIYVLARIAAKTSVALNSDAVFHVNF
jgi:hypothetical protein